MSLERESRASPSGEDHLVRPRKSADTALAESEARYRALVRASSSLVWTTAADGKIVDMPEWRALTGQTVEEVRGWGWLNALHPDDRSRVEVVWQAALDTRSIYETEYRIRHRDGVYVWYQVRGAPVLEDDGSVREWVGLCVDIEDQKRAAQQRLEAEKALRDLNETLEQRVEAEARDRARIWNVSQDLLVVADREGKYLNVNPAWTATLGWSEADLVGKTSEWLLHPNDHEKTRAELARLAEGHRTLRFENRLRDKDGTYCWLSWTAVPDRGLIYAVARNVTELRNTEQKLHETQAELQRVSRLNTISEITASIAHEIRQPLAAVRTDGDTCIRWLRTQPPNLEKAHATAARISENAHRASEIIDRIQALFRKTEPALSWLNINDVINDVVLLLRGEMRYRDVLLSVELQADLSPVLADRVQLQQVMLNLMMNGAEAMSEVSERPRTLLVKSEAESTGAVVVSVEDSGIGLDPATVGKIFEAFYSTKLSGMGMGLSICRSIVESYDGNLRALPRRPYGAIFQFTLPPVFSPR